MEAALQFRDLAHYCHGGWHEDRQVLEKELRVLHLGLQATGSELYPTLGAA